MFSVMTDINDSILRGILEGEFTNKTAYSYTNRAIVHDNFNKVKSAYKSCMDKDAIKKAGVAPLRALLEEMEMYYPATRPHESQNVSGSSNKELTEVLIWLTKRTVPTLINSAVVVSLPKLISDIFNSYKPFRTSGRQQEPTGFHIHC